MNNYKCGVKYIPEFIRKILSKHFNECCKLHDQYYNDTSIDRFNCDKIFLKDMVTKSEKDRYVVIAIVYYFAVRIFGKPFKKIKE